MKKINKLALVLATLAIVGGFSAKSQAAETAVVDLDRIRENYTVAQDLTADMKVKEDELQSFIENAQKQIQAAKTEVEKRNLEEKLAAQFNVKRMAYAKDQSDKWSKVEETVLKSITDIVNAKKYDLVLNKQVVIYGGTDITDEVLNKLNGKSKK